MFVATIELDRLLEDISPDSPCGENLEYDPDFVLLEQSARGKPEQQFGATIVPAEEPDWAEVRRLAIDLCKRTRDLRVFDYLARASVRTHGYAGLNDVLTLVRGSLERHWDDIYPRLDPDDDNDPTARVNIIASLCDPQIMLLGVRQAPLVQSRGFGRFGLRDLAIASGEAPPPAGMDAPPTMQAIEGAFRETALEDLQATADAVRSAAEQSRAIESVVTEKVGAANAASLDALTKLLKEAGRAIDTRLVERGGGAPAGGLVNGEAVNGHALNGGTAPLSVTGQLQSREDVVRMLDKICEYYARVEPSSPVPVLLERAKKLVPMSFMEIVQNLIPDGASQAQLYLGPSE
jgi:type VI secretion system protein ImpA